MTREDWSYLAGALLITMGCGAVYWPAALIVSGALVLLPRFAEWAFVMRSGTEPGEPE